jgi:hypothetical protein
MRNKQLKPREKIPSWKSQLVKKVLLFLLAKEVHCDIDMSPLDSILNQTNAFDMLIRHFLSLP